MINVLLVEDSVDDAFVFSEMLGLAPSGFSCTRVSTVRESLQFLSEHSADVIVLDLNLPDGSGVDTFSKVVDATDGLPVVVLTGLDDKEIRLQLVRCGAQDIVLKGDMTPELLARTLTHAIERDKLKNRIRQAEVQLRRLIVYAADAMLVVNDERKVLFANQAAEVFLSRKMDVLIGSEFNYDLSPGTALEIEVHDDGVRFGGMLVSEIDWNGEPCCLVSIRDITERKIQEEDLRRLAAEAAENANKLERLALVDSLTEVLNKRGLNQALERELERGRRLGATVSILMLDCDQFAEVNQRFGQVVGSVMLQEIAGRIRDTMRTPDYVGRVGGDSFLCILPETTHAEAVAIAERLRLVISSHHFLFTSEPFNITVSVGVETLHNEAANLDTVLMRVRPSVDKAKRSGRNRISAAGGAGLANAHEMSGLLGALVDGDSLAVNVVPIVNLTTEETVGHSLHCSGEGPFHNPDVLYQLAREHGMLTDIDMSNITSCVQRVARNCPGGELHVSVFPNTLATVPVERIVAQLKAANVDRTWCLDVNQRQFVGAPYDLMDGLNQLRDAGIKYAIGDVGAGRGTFDYAALLSPDYVRISPRFVQGVAADAHKRRYLKRIVTFMEKVGAELIADGVSDRADATYLQTMGVTQGQGVLWSQ